MLEVLDDSVSESEITRRLRKFDMITEENVKKVEDLRFTLDNYRQKETAMDMKIQVNRHQPVHLDAVYLHHQYTSSNLCLISEKRSPPGAAGIRQE